MNVRFCKNSTLREAHATVLGLPSAISPDEFSTLRARFTREWPAHEFSSLQALLPPDPPVTVDPEAATAPTWFGQLQWDDRRWVGRWGHRVLALHRIVGEGERYHTFSSTFRPTLERWLQVAQEAYAFIGIDPPTATAVFGYLNVFTLGPEDGDLSEWFHMNVAVAAAGSEGGLTELAFGVRIPRPDERSNALIAVTARSDGPETVVTVQTIVDRALPEGMSFSRTSELLDQIGCAKTLAKDTFFSFVTERALERMGAMDAEPEA